MERNRAELDAALEHFRRALALEPSDAAVLGEIGETLEIQGDTEGALNRRASSERHRRADMAENKGQQGTGHHPHKSTEEPWPHTKEEDTAGGKSHSSGRDDGNRSHGGSHQTQSRGQDQDREEEADLKRREYQGADGEIHHHTRTYMEQHGTTQSSEEERGGGDRSHSRSGSQGGSHGNSRSGHGR